MYNVLVGLPVPEVSFPNYQKGLGLVLLDFASFGHSGLDPESIACTDYGFRIKPGMTVVN